MAVETTSSVVTPLLDTPELRSMLFFPRRNPPGIQFPPSSTHVTEPLRFPASRGTNLHCLAFRMKMPPSPGSSTPSWVVYFHGNGELAYDYASDMPWAADSPMPTLRDFIGSFAFNVLFVEYRGYGASEGEAEVCVDHVYCSQPPSL